MNYKDAVKSFKDSLNLGEYDYWTVQLMWSEYTDGLCRNGEITTTQFSKWLTPFPYGKRVVVYNEKVVTSR